MLYSGQGGVSKWGTARMSFSTRFSETRLEQEHNRVRLVGQADEVILELKGHEIHDAVRAGFVDPANFHFSMFEFARIRAIAPPSPASPAAVNRAADSTFDRGFLSGLNICWD